MPVYDAVGFDIIQQVPDAVRVGLVVRTAISSGYGHDKVPNSLIGHDQLSLSASAKRKHKAPSCI